MGTMRLIAMQAHTIRCGCTPEMKALDVWHGKHNLPCPNPASVTEIPRDEIHVAQPGFDPAEHVALLTRITGQLALNQDSHKQALINMERKLDAVLTHLKLKD